MLKFLNNEIGTCNYYLNYNINLDTLASYALNFSLITLFIK